MRAKRVPEDAQEYKAEQQLMYCSDVFMLFTFGAQVICIPGTGRVVMYMVTQRYKYRVPMRKKKRLLAIDLQTDNIRATIE